MFDQEWRKLFDNCAWRLRVLADGAGGGALWSAVDFEALRIDMEHAAHAILAVANNKRYVEEEAEIARMMAL